MEKDNSRALRRHHLARMKKKRSGHYLIPERALQGRVLDRMLGLVANTATLCSCYMCGNPRRYDKARTLQEISAIEWEKKSER